MNFLRIDGDGACEKTPMRCRVPAGNLPAALAEWLNLSLANRGGGTPLPRIV